MGTYTCQECGSQFEHHFEKKTCSDECANAARSKASERQWDERSDEMAASVSKAMNRPDVREHMRRTQMGEKNSMAGRTGVSNPAYKNRAKFGLDYRGYEAWRVDELRSVKAHRLLAVAEYGFDAVKGMHVHHKNRIRWDNRPENIELVTNSEHAKLHGLGGRHE